MATTEKWAKLFKSRHQYMDSIPIQFGDAKDAALTWDGTNLTLKPVANDTGAVIVGDGTTSMDFKVFGGTTGKYILLDVGGSLFTISAGIGLSLADTTDASSLTTGSITTLGGVSITKQLFLGDDIDMSVSGTGVYDITLKDAMADALSIVRGTTDMIVFNSSTPLITITPATTITGVLTTNGGIANTGTLTVTSASAVALAVGRLGATTPALVVDASTATSITGISIKSAAASGGVAIAAVGETNVALTLNGAGNGTIGIGSVSTGVVTITPATTITGAITASSTLGIVGLVTSTSVTGFRSNPTFVPDGNRTNYAFSAGNRVAALTVTIGAGVTQHLDPFQLNILVAGVNPGGSSTLNGFYQLITHSTAMANMRLKNADWNIAMSANVLDAYCYQGELDFTSTMTVGGEAAVLGLVANASAAVTGNVRGAIISMQGTGTGLTAVGLEIRTTCGTAGAGALSEAIRIAGTPLPVVGIALGNQTNDNEGPQFAFFFPYNGGAGGGDIGPWVATNATGDAGKIAVKLGSTTKYINLYNS